MTKIFSSTLEMLMVCKIWKNTFLTWKYFSGQTLWNLKCIKKNQLVKLKLVAVLILQWGFIHHNVIKLQIIYPHLFQSSDITQSHNMNFSNKDKIPNLFETKHFYDVSCKIWLNLAEKFFNQKQEPPNLAIFVFQSNPKWEKN